MRNLKRIVGLIGGLLVSGCATHLPPLETAPGSGGPRVSDIVDHLNCELATIVDGSDPRIVKRLGDTKEAQLRALLPYLAKYHFVASVQLTLEVTDAEGLSPQLSFIHPLSAAMTNQTTVGGLSLNGSQDRSVTINYSVDLANLSKLGAKTPCVVSPGLLQSVGLSGGLNGDLGLADVVSDGLITMQKTQSLNVYGASGPTPLATREPIALSGAVIDPATETKIDDASLSGQLVFVPPAPGTLTPGTVSINGQLVISTAGATQTYIVSWTGNASPFGQATSTFALAGTTIALADPSGQTIRAAIGVSPTISLAGKTSSDFMSTNPQLFGTLVTQVLATGQQPKPLELQFPAPGAVSALAATTPKSGPGASAATSTTSFGSLVDFVVVAGVNGGPTWTLVHLKESGGGGSGGAGNANGSQLFGVNRTNTDSLSITFVPSCQDTPVNRTDATTFWDTVPVCDQSGTAGQTSALAGYQSNSLMVLRQFLLKSGRPSQP